MITTDLDRLEYTQANSENTKVFRSSGTDIPVKDASHIKVYVTNKGTFDENVNTNVFTDVAHGLLDTEIVRVSSSTDDLPLGLLPNTDYYVRDKTSDTFKLSLSSGGTAVAITDIGSGTFTWTKTLLKTINTDYTIALSGTTATLTWATDKRPANDDKVLLLRQVPFEQNTDLQNNSLFEAESVETQLDLIVNMSQQLKNTTARDLKFSDLLTAENATESQATLNVTSDDRKNKALKFDNSGNLTVSKLNLDDANDYVLEAKSWSIETGGYTKTYDAEVASNNNDYSAKEYAVGSTVTSAKDYATKTSAAVTGSEFSAKEYAQGTQASTGGSSKDWAVYTAGDVRGGSSGDMSAKEWAVGVQGRGVANEGSAKDWATRTTATVDNADYSAKEFAIGTTASTGGSAKDFATYTGGGVRGSTSDHSAKAWAVGGTGVTTTASKGAAKEWATTTGAKVDGGSGDYSAKEYAIGTTVAEGSAKDWAVQAVDSAVTGSSYSALHHATKAAESASASEANAVSMAIALG